MPSPIQQLFVAVASLRLLSYLLCRLNLGFWLRNQYVMKRIVYFAAVALFGILSVYLTIAEMSLSQDFVREYFMSTLDPVALYAVNTSLGVFLFWGAALLFLSATSLPSNDEDPEKEDLFLWSQVGVFAFLCSDERFRLHENIGRILGFRGTLLLVIPVGLELTALFMLGRIQERPLRQRRCIMAAGLLFLGMVIIEGILPRDWPPRLALGNLAKLCASFFLFLFAWEVLAARVDPNSHSTHRVNL